MNIDERLKIKIEKKLKKGSRISWIIVAAIVGILVNTLLAIVKVLIGLFSNSIAITSDAINNLSDALSSIVTIVGIIFASKSANKKHPYGYGRIEYISSLIISVLLVIVGWEFFKTSIDFIKNPKEIKFNIFSLIVLLFAIVGKIFLGSYNKKIGKKTNSPALMASSKDSYSDVLISTMTVISTLIYMIFDVLIDGYVGIFISLFIIFSGISLIDDTLNSIIGKEPEEKVVNEIYKFVKKSEKVEGAYDLILNNYGPERYIGSINVAFLDTMSLSEASLEILKLQNSVFKKFGIYLVFGIYSKNTQNENVSRDEKKIREIISKYNGIESMHAFYILYEEKLIRIDIVVDFNVKNVNELVKNIRRDISKIYIGYEIILNIDHNYV